MATAEVTPDLRGFQGLIANKEKAKTRYTPPDPEHYPHGYLWDSGIHAVVYARSGHPELAQEELETVFSWQNKETGFIANIKFHPEKGTGHLERRVIFGKNAETSKYSQPFVLAWAIWETYESYRSQGMFEEANSFLANNYDSPSSFIRFLMNERENKSDNLIKVVHPHETARDFDPTFHFTNPLHRRRAKNPIASAVVDKFNLISDQTARLLYGKMLQKHEYDPNLFDVNDVMFNVIYADGLSYMSKIAQELGKNEEADFFHNKSECVSRDIIETMWDDTDGIFYAKRHGVPIEVASISGLTPLMLGQIKPFQIEKIAEKIEDPEWFGTTFPLSSVPTHSPYFNPDFSDWGLWGGGTWVPTNLLMSMALKRRAAQVRSSYPRLAQRLEIDDYILVQQTKEMVRRGGFAECFNPFTGAPQRKQVKNFGMSTAAYVM